MKISVLASLERDNYQNSNFSEILTRFLELGTIAETLEYSTLFLVKNTANEKNLVVDPNLLQAALARAVKTLRLGAGFAPFGFFDPIALAASCATLDVLCDGRLTILIDEGARLRQRAWIKLESQSPERQFLDNRNLLRTALLGERFSSTTGLRRASNLRIPVRPLQAPHPPIHTAVYDKQAAAEAGASGFRIFLSPLAAFESPDDVEELIAAFRQAQSQAGVTSTEDYVIAFCLACAAPDNDQASERGREAFTRHALIRPNWACRDFDAAMDLDYLLVGGPKILAAKLRRLRDIGLNHIALMPMFGGLPMDQVIRTMQIAAKAAS